ncbi:hypothetical protein BST81_22215 [Leptolyngbya sp. 'hensonii']|uniref:hybrid sensor histidine kinase/response regulator n=1 Tax=Leptolyngbya sp. 'hensonii' TaxID=1922337 RepID=UPI00094FDD97|nr:hybrid sensor histidine kinase/response regulator [Leptolyngbya sp. 'hensonii']OLP16312.1 hypothetical protein BST81_22215 [Leptolyngbya sp. 'hensonii']
MAVDIEIQDQAYKFFMQESIEFLQTIESGLLNLRTDRSTPQIHALMRAAHSIKGGAASVGLESIQILAHRLEDIFRAFYSDTTEIDGELENDLLQAFDCLKAPLLEQIQTGQHDFMTALEQGEPIFTRLETRLADALSSNAELPTAAELGIDIVQAVFTGDVEGGLTRLEHILSHPEGAEVMGEIRAQAEVFVGIGELLNLPGFKAIAEATITALNTLPQEALAIGWAAISDFRAAQAFIIAGDREQGGHPLSLLAFSQPVSIANDTDPEPDPKNLDELFGNLDETSFISSLDLQPDGRTEVVRLEFETRDNLDGNEDLEAIFGQSLNLSVLEEIPAALTAPPEDLEAIFGQSPNLSMALEETPEALVDSPEDLEAIFGQSPNLSIVLEDLDSVPEKTQNDPVVEILPPVNPDPQATPDAPYLANTVKVDLSRLERLNNLVGELVTHENSALSQNQQLQGTLDLTLLRLSRFEQITKQLQDWIDRGQNTQVQIQSPDRAASLNLSLTEFDPLQMDSYSHLHLLVQETIEEMAQVGEAMRDMMLLNQQSQQTLRKKQQTLKQVRNDLLWSRMLPLGDLLQRLPRMVRDLAHRYHKQVTLKLSGTATLVDKAMLERLYDPLVHLVRNAFDHGIELPETRQAAGKAAQATIEIRAYHRGNQTYIEIRDDGQGIDPEKIRQKIVALNLGTASEVAALNLEQLYEYLFMPAFSTATQVSELSGRGMGLTTVRSQVKALKGSLSILSEPGQGTTFVLRLPLTLTIAKLLVFSANGNLMALPIDTLMAILTVPDAEIQTIQGRQFYSWQGQLLPLYPQSEFGHQYPLVRQDTDNLKAMTLPEDGKTPLLLISGGDKVIALEVDQILQEQELVIKPFGRAVNPPPYLYGCTILADGALVPVIDGPALVAQWLRSSTGTEPKPPMPPPIVPHQETATILVVDDSLTTRQTLALTLKKANYRVVQARDGREALEQLRQEPGIQAVFCDIEMPQMNGFEFLSHCRQEFSRAVLPVIMLTSRSSDKHRRLAQLMGATTYLTKPYLEHELLKTLQTCLNEIMVRSTRNNSQHQSAQSVQPIQAL